MISQQTLPIQKSIDELEAFLIDKMWELMNDQVTTYMKTVEGRITQKESSDQNKKRKKNQETGRDTYRQKGKMAVEEEDIDSTIEDDDVCDIHQYDHPKGYCPVMLHLHEYWAFALNPKFVQKQMPRLTNGIDSITIRWMYKQLL